MSMLIAIALIVILCTTLRTGPTSKFRFLRRALRLRNEGKPEAAAALIVAEINRGCAHPAVINLAVESLTSAGRYSEALALPTVFTAEDTPNEVLVQINLAEAEYNLGCWQGAWDRLSSLDEVASRFEITCAGLALQRAWILAHTGRAPEALLHWKRADIHGLPYPYRAEHYFTHVAVLLALGRIDDAQDAAFAGADAVARPSSERNAWFMLARVAAARRSWTKADWLCRKAANHFYRGQGGDGLLLWGDVLVQLGRPAEAREAYQMCIGRDGQSESARTAALRLAAQPDRAVCRRESGIELGTDPG